MEDRASRRNCPFLVKPPDFDLRQKQTAIVRREEEEEEGEIFRGMVPCCGFLCRFLYMIANRDVRLMNYFFGRFSKKEDARVLLGF